MRIRDLFKKHRPASRTVELKTDWTNGWTTRDWADLPVHHPRREDEAIR